MDGKYEDNLIELIDKYIRANGYVAPTLKMELYTHKDFPSLYSISDTLSYLRIPNLSVRLTNNDLSHISEAFLTYMKTAQGHLEPVLFEKKLGTNEFLIQGISGKKERFSKKEFYNTWAGISLLVEPNKKALKEQRFNRLLSLTAILGILFIPFLKMPTLNVNLLVNYLTAILGLLVGSLLVSIELNFSLKGIQQFCNTGRQFNCRSILFSKGAYLTSFLKLTDLVIIYFLIRLLFLLVSSQSSHNLLLLNFLSFLSTPFIIYSLFYQAKHRQWCKMCLIIDLLLLVDLLVVDSLTFEKGHISYSSIALLFIMTVISFVAWRFTRSMLSDNQKINPVIANWIAFRRSWKLFLPYFFNSKPVSLPSSIDFYPTQVNEEGIWSLILILNPSCPTCKEALEMIFRMQQNIRCFKSIKIVFNIDASSLTSRDALIALNVMEYSQKSNKDWLEIYLEWSHSRNYNKWFKEHGRIFKVTEVLEQRLTTIHRWCVENQLDKTPTILINGIPFPYLYNVSDFELLFSNLYESYLAVESDMV